VLVPKHFDMRLSAGTQSLFTVMMVAGVLIFIADLIALTWLSMWRGMNARHSYTAFLWSAVQLLLFPWIVFYVAMTAFFMAVFLPQVTRGGTALGRATTQWMEWMPFILTGIWFLVSLGTAVFSVWLARKSLRKYFRYQATAWYQPSKAFWPRRAKPGKLPPRLA
jgi:hypothetical protein